MHQKNHDVRLTLTEAARVVPGRPHASTLWRWARRGIRARNGQRIRLRHQRLGARVYVTRDWLDQFATEVAAADCEAIDAEEDDLDVPPQAKHSKPRNRDAAIDRAEQRLIAEGIRIRPQSHAKAQSDRGQRDG